MCPLGAASYTSRVNQTRRKVSPPEAGRTKTFRSRQVARSLRRSCSSFSASAKRLGFTIPHTLRSTTQVSGHDFSRAVQAAPRIIPYAVGSRAAAPSRPAFGLLGRNAAKRAKNNSKSRAFIDRCCTVKRTSHCSFPHSLTKANIPGSNPRQNPYDLKTTYGRPAFGM
jgi:hypothetical protein